MEICSDCLITTSYNACFPRRLAEEYKTLFYLSIISDITRHSHHHSKEQCITTGPVVSFASLEHGVVTGQCLLSTLEPPLSTVPPQTKHPSDPSPPSCVFDLSPGKHPRRERMYIALTESSVVLREAPIPFTAEVGLELYMDLV